MRRLPAPLLLVLGWAALTVSWALANPPFMVPDEAAHFIRAIGVGGGELAGAEPQVVAPGPNPKQTRFLEQTTRVVEVPGRYVPADAGCFVRDPKVPAGCLDAYRPAAQPVPGPTYVAAYPPAPYFLPGWALRLGDDAIDALYWARLAALLLPLALLAAGAWLAWDPRAGPLSLAGPAAAVTPMALYCAGGLTGSGLEIAAGFCLAAGVLRASRSAAAGGEAHDGRASAPADAAVWAAIAVSGALLVVSRSASLVWAALLLAMGIALAGPRHAWALVRSSRGAWVAAAALAAAAAVSFAWDAAYGPELLYSVRNFREAFGEGWQSVWSDVDDVIGDFSYLEFSLPLPVVILGWLVILAPVVAAARYATPRERLLLAAVALALPLVPFTFQVVIARHQGFGITGRHVLPVVVALPLLAGELLVRHREAVGAGLRRALPAAVAAGAALVHLGAFWANGRRAAVGIDGSWAFVFDAAWDPPLGWAPWTLLALAGAAALAAAPLVAARR